MSVTYPHGENSLEEKTPALGLMGAKESIPGLLEYRIPGVEDNETASDKLKSHSAFSYLDGLAKILKGELPSEERKIDHHAIASPIAMPKYLQTTIPESVGTVKDTL